MLRVHPGTERLNGVFSVPLCLCGKYVFFWCLLVLSIR